MGTTFRYGGFATTKGVLSLARKADLWRAFAKLTFWTSRSSGNLCRLAPGFSSPLGAPEIHEKDGPYAHAVGQQIQEAELRTHQAGANPHDQMPAREQLGWNQC